MSVPNKTRPVSALDDHALGLEYHHLEFRWMSLPERDHTERIRDAERMEAIREERATRCAAEAARSSATPAASNATRPRNDMPRAVEFRGGKVVRR